MRIWIMLILATVKMPKSATLAKESLLGHFFYNPVEFIEMSQCDDGSTRRYAIIIHGWKESCTEPWVKTLVKNLQKYRRGCIICMDYSVAARNPNYFFLARHTDVIIATLMYKLQELERRGFDPNDGYMFGFSLGGRIALEAGRLYGKQKIAEIDVCDMAGPGFDLYEQPDPKDSAQNVQCIHTSRGKGTKHRDCHQNWNMGYCGRNQLAASRPPLGSHGLCPRFYNSAFEFDFYAEHIPEQCAIIPTGKWPKNFKMGYMERRKFNTQGEFYASTTEEYPYTPNIYQRKSISQAWHPFNKFYMLIGGKKYFYRIH